MLKKTVAVRLLSPTEEAAFHLVTNPIVDSYLDIPQHLRNSDNPLYCRLESDMRMVMLRMDLVWRNGQLRKIVK